MSLSGTPFQQQVSTGLPVRPIADLAHDLDRALGDLATAQRRVAAAERAIWQWIASTGIDMTPYLPMTARELLAALPDVMSR
jgi:hypothetical protein